MLQKSTLVFLKSLKKNNNREWFAENKMLYEDAKRDFEIFVDALIQKISGFDKSVIGLQPKNCIFRIFKDIRFTKDKTPYKTNFGASINKGGKKVHYAGYYFHLEPGSCFLAGGVYMPMPDQLLKIRTEIFKKANEFKRIINNKEFVKNFGEIWGEKLKTSPKGFPRDHPAAEHLKYKSFIAYHEISDKQVMLPSIFDYAAKIYKTMMPLNDFLNNC